MVTCPKCGATGIGLTQSIRILHQDPIDPARDEFRCRKCDLRFHRYDPPIVPTFSVVEYSSFFAVRHNPTGKEAHMGDGVDTLFDENDNPLSPGSPGFVEMWADSLNASEDETLEAYFPELASDDESPDIVGPTALVVQKFGAVRKEYGPFPVTIGPDFDECGLERSVLKEVTRAARIEGAETGYCDIIIHDADGNELDTETAVI